MAHIETWYRCPICRCAYDTQREATRCKNMHPVAEEQWAIGKYKAVRISGHCAPDGRGGINWALREADLSDDIKERARQLEEIGQKEKFR